MPLGINLIIGIGGGGCGGGVFPALNHVFLLGKTQSGNYVVLTGKVSNGSHINLQGKVA